MTTISNEPGAYEVRRNGVVIGCAYLCGDGIWRAATLLPVDLWRCSGRDEGVARVQRNVGLMH